jgi:uncharacterized protein (TIGR03546 family)
MFFLKVISKLLKALRSADSPRQIAWGFALGAIPGLTPFWSLHNLIIVALIIILKVNISAALLAWMLFSFFAWLLDPLFHALGFAVLVKISFLESIWTSLYNAPVAPFTRFNNTVLMGSLVCSLILLVPNYWLFKGFVLRYRESWDQKIQKWRIVQILKGSKIVRLYVKLKDMGA